MAFLPSQMAQGYCTVVAMEIVWYAPRHHICNSSLSQVGAVTGIRCPFKYGPAEAQYHKHLDVSNEVRLMQTFFFKLYKVKKKKKTGTK